MNGDKIQVCTGWWRQRCGNVVRIERSSAFADFPWQCAADVHFCDDGRWYPTADGPRDLVEFIGKNITITSADIDIPELRVPMLFWVCPDCVESVITWHRGVATCDNCRQTSVD